jgi:hypothetical protein
VGAVVMVLRGRFRRHWKSWLALSVLVAVAGGFVLATAAAGRRTAAAFPDFVARHGYDVVVYSEQPLPGLARLPHVASVTQVLALYSGTPACPSCRHPIDDRNFLINEVPPAQLPRMVTLLSGRMPRQSDPSEVLASFTLAKDNGVRIGSVLRVPLASPAQLRTGKLDGPPAARPTLRVVGIVAAEAEFPSGASLHYDLYTTTAFATAVNHRAALLSTSYVRLAHGAADLAGFDGRLRKLSLDVYGTLDLDAAAVAVEESIAPQVIGWYVLAGLAALAALAVIGQAVARQTVSEMTDQRDLSALGVRPREFVLLALARAGLIGTVGAVGAMLAAVLVSPLTPVGEARLAVPAPGSMSFEPVVLPLGALAVLAAVIAVSIWPAVHHVRSPGRRSQPAMPVATAAARSAARAGLPPSAVIGIRHALERGRDGQPVGTALLGMAAAVAALCATAVFGTSLAHLVSSPTLYGAPFQAYFAGDGTPGSQSLVTGPLLDGLRKDPAIEQITLSDFVEININGSHVRTVAVTPLLGPALLSAVDGRLPGGDRDIMLGAATMRAAKARLGGTVRVTVTDPEGKPHEASFRVIGRASLNAGAGGLGHGAVITTSGFIGAQCPPGSGHSACANAVRKGMTATAVMVRATPGAAGSVALARHIRQYPDLTYRPVEPTVLVNFGESVNFPLLFGVALSVFGLATLAHLLLVSVARRRVEAGLLRALGFVGRQVAAVVCWQATAVALAGIVVGAPAGIAAGRVLWRVFATNFGVVPVDVVEPLLIAALVAGVVAAANVVAAVPALLAARSQPARLLRAE